jgi:hypothetical protein
VRGERFSGADGVYFNELRLTPKGERTAIQHRQSSQGIGSVEEAVEEVEAILEEPKKLGDKK